MGLGGPTWDASLRNVATVASAKVTDRSERPARAQLDEQSPAEDALQLCVARRRCAAQVGERREQREERRGLGSLQLPPPDLNAAARLLELGGLEIGNLS